MNIDPEAVRGWTAVDADSSFSVGKSPPQNGTPVFEKTSGTGGLGEGTPKVSTFTEIPVDFLYYFYSSIDWIFF